MQAEGFSNLTLDTITRDRPRRNTPRDGYTNTRRAVVVTRGRGKKWIARFRIAFTGGFKVQPP